LTDEQKTTFQSFLDEAGFEAWLNRVLGLQAGHH
jgi:hypothetical protein